MNIRPEQQGDETAISQLTTRAFDDAPHASGTEAAIVEQLRADGDLTISLVVSDGDRLIGHIAFSPVTIIRTANDRDDGWFGLGPVSVLPGRQGEGVGSALVREGLKRLEAKGAKGCVLLGDPAFYARFGFRGDGGLSYGEAPRPYVQWLGFNGESPVGDVKYRPGFDV